MADEPNRPALPTIDQQTRATIMDGQVIDLRAFGVHVSASRNAVSIHGSPDLRTPIQWDALYGLLAAARGYHDRLRRGERIEL